MNEFEYRDGVLHCEGVALQSAADRFGTPLYVYSRSALVGSFQRLSAAFQKLQPRICFSIKSCHNLHVLRVLRKEGAWFDAVSIGEVRRALEAGAAAETIVFAGVGKTPEELALAVRLDVGCINIESEGELAALAELAARADKTIRAAVRINPDVDAITHPYTTTGKSENKFGVSFEAAREMLLVYTGHDHVRLSGLHVHIGSPVRTVAPYMEAINRLLAFIEEVRAAGAVIDAIDIGGGFPAAGDEQAPAIEEYASAVAPLLEGRALAVHLEPGRSIAADAGVLLAKALYVKQGATKRFVVVDAAMTELIRPALYRAEHFVWPVTPGADLVPENRLAGARLPQTVRVDVVGPVCESGDFLARDRWLPPVDPGDLLAVFSAGAYGAVMSSQYNSRPRAAEVLVSGEEAHLIRRRETYDDLVAAERDADR